MLPACFDMYRVEVHEPRFENGAGGGFERFVLAAVGFDLVVQRAEDVRNGALFIERS